MPQSRRTFLRVGISSLAYFTVESTTPSWIVRAANAMSCNCTCDGRILVILQLAGGNDGLSTVIPRTDPCYFDTLTITTLRVASS